MTELEVAHEIQDKMRYDAGQLNNWAFIPRQTKQARGIEIEIGRICLANLMYQKIPFNVKYFIFNPKMHTPATKDVKRYVSWLANKSPLSPAFKSKDTNDIVERGAIFSTNFPPQFVVTAAMTLRYVAEFPHIIRFWNIFQRYTPPEAALVMAHNFHPFNGNAWQVGPYGNTNHQWIQQDNFGKRELKKFMEFSPVLMDGETMEITQNYRSLTKIWGYKKVRIDPIQVPKGKEASTDSCWGGDNMVEYFHPKNVRRLCREWLELNYDPKNK